MQVERVLEKTFSKILLLDLISNIFLWFVVDTFIIRHVIVMTIRRTRKRQKAYLRKIWYLRNFLSLIKLYRTYLYWKYRKRRKHALKWQSHDAICWKTFKIRWNPNAYQYRYFSFVIFHFFGSQLTATLTVFNSVPSAFLLTLDELIIDKIFLITLTHETVWNYCLHAFLSSLATKSKEFDIVNIFI